MTPQSATSTTRWKRLLQVTPGSLDPQHLFLSTNSKTGLSLNASIARTCRPTKACARYCYGLEGRIRMPKALERQVDNTEMFDRLAGALDAAVDAEACLMAEEVRCHQDFLRVFGVGDLQPGSVRFITALAKVAPDISLWVSTRQFSLAEKLPVRSNLHVMLSLDSTTKHQDQLEARALCRARGSNTYLAWVQLSAEEIVPDDISVVFAEHRVGSGRAAWTRESLDLRTCPATIAEGAPHDGACASCRFCFDGPVRQRMANGPGFAWLSS